MKFGYSQPVEIRFGAGTRTEVAEVMRKHGFKRGILVADASLVANGRADEVAKAAGLAAAAFVLACPACISAFSAACKEVGFKYAAKIFALQLAFAFACGYVVRFVAGIFD